MNKHEKQFYLESDWLAVIIKDPSLWEDKTVHSSHLFAPHNKAFYYLLEKLIQDKKPLHISTWNTLTTGQYEDIGGKERLREVVNRKVSATVENLRAIEKEMQTYYIGENIIKLVQHLPQNESYELEELRTIAQNIHEVVDGVGTKRKTFNELLMQTHDKLMNLPLDGLSGVDTGYNNLNATLDGWTKGAFYIIGARPSVGKTAFTVNSALRTSMKGDFATYIPAETGDESIVKRMICMLSDLPMDKVKNPRKHMNKEELSRYHKAVQKLNMLDIHIEGLQDVNDIKQLMRERVRKHKGNHVVFIDHLAHLSLRNKRFNNKNDEYETYCKILKDMAVELDIAVVLLSQLNRESAKREDKRGQLFDLRDSGALEQIGDVIAFLHRENYQKEEQDKEERDLLEFIIRKNRDGELGTVLFEFTGQNMRVIEA